MSHRSPTVCRSRHDPDPDNTVYTLDSSIIDICISRFPWAPLRSAKAAVRLHTLLDLCGNILAFTHIFDGKLHSVSILDQLFPQRDAFYIMDYGFGLCAVCDPQETFAFGAKSLHKFTKIESDSV